jgi:hypothetical protein
MSTQRLHIFSVLLLSLLLSIGVASLSSAQIVTTGNLRVEAADEHGAKLAGVKVTVSSPALIGKTMERSTSDQGQARFPTLPPGVYAVRFEKDGFGTTVRDGINVDVALTYMVRVTMKAGAGQEVTTISGDTPTIDETTAEVGTTVASEHLENIPTARDVWAVMQQAPRMRMERFDVGGSTMGTQTGYNNFGISGQNRPMLDGVNLTEGTSGSGFYFDYGTFEQVNISGMGNNAEMPVPGTGYTMVIKSGGNAYHGMFYTDYENSDFQSDNLTDELRKPWPEGQGITTGDRLIFFKTYNFNVGGYAIKDRLWFFVGGFYQSMDKEKLGYALRPGIDPTTNDKAHGPFVSGKLKGTAGTLLANPTWKVTVLPTASDRVVLFMADNWKTFPERGGDALNPPETTYWQASNAYARKLGWMHAFGTKGLLDVTVGLGGYKWPDWSNGAGRPAYQDIGTRLYSGSRWAGDYQNYDPKRWQFYPTMTLFVDNWLGGSHDIKFGFDREKYEAERFYAGHPDNVRYYLNNGAPYQVDLMNTPTRYDYWTWTNAAFVTDTFAKGKWAFSLGVRWDSYRCDLPDMEWGGNNWAGVNPMFGPQKFPGATGLVDWSAFAPRLGVTYLLTPNTVLKANYGRYWFFPGLLSSSANKNTLGGAIYRWTDVNGNRLLDPQLGEIGPLVSEYGARVATIDPNLKQPYGDEFFVSIDRELPGGVSLRGLYLYQATEDNWQTYNAAWPIDQSGYDPVQVRELDEGGNPTGQFLTLWNLKPEYRGRFNDQVTSFEAYDRNHNLEVVVRRRMSGGWQVMSSLDLTWEKQQGLPSSAGGGSGAPWNPNFERFVVQSLLQGIFKLSASFSAPYDIRVSPVVRYQLGNPWGRRAAYTSYIGPDGRSVAFNQGTVYVWMEEQNSRRRPNVTLIDFRAEKTFRLVRGMSAGVMFDLFNILNSNAMVNTTDLTGANFNKWIEILTPRIFRLGARFTF